MRYVLDTNFKVFASHKDAEKIRDKYPGYFVLDSSSIYLRGDTISDLAVLKTAYKITIKEIAEKKILTIIPEWKQRNYTARAVELVDKGRLTWVQAELDEWNMMDAIWVRIKALRSYSDTLETNVDGAANSAALQAINVDTGWPE